MSEQISSGQRVSDAWASLRERYRRHTRNVDNKNEVPRLNNMRNPPSPDVPKHEKLPISDPEFWRDRLEKASSIGEIHKAVHHIDITEWKELLEVHRDVLSNMFNPYEKTRVLDVGCGIGTLLEILPENIDYVGIDISPDFIEIAKKSYPGYTFIQGDARYMPFQDRRFDVAIARSVDGMIKTHLGFPEWRRMEREILRVSNRLILLGYTHPTMYRVTDAVPDPKEYAQTVLECDGGRLIYRPGQDGTVELYDLFVTEENRRKGVARKLVQTVMKEAFGCVYGFVQIDNPPVHALYESLGFKRVNVPGFYRGVDAYMYVYRCLPVDTAHIKLIEDK